MRLLCTTSSMAPSFLSRASRFAINTISRLPGLAALLLLADPGALLATNDSFTTNYVAGTLIQLNDNGAWSWFMDPRVIVDDGKLISGSVRAIGTFQSGASDPRWANVEIAVYDIAAKKTATIVLHPHLEQDDHDAPAFLVRPDGRYMAMYSKHAAERKMYYRISEPHNPLVWGPTLSVETPGADANYAGNNDTYANPFRLPDGRIVNFYRGFHHEPNYMVSKDEGQTWTYGGHWLYGKGGMDLRYHYARWDGAAWHSEEIAHAGGRLYPGEDDYSGLGALDPKNPDIVYISTDADPVSGAPLASQADHCRHYELFRGTREQQSGSWKWTPITRNSTYDNLRPVIPKWNDPRTAP